VNEAVDHLGVAMNADLHPSTKRRVLR